MPKRPTVGPGGTVPDSGIYKAGSKRATLVEGKTAPPTPEKKQAWKQEIDTNPNDASSKAKPKPAQKPKPKK